MKHIFRSILLCSLLLATTARAQFVPGGLFERNQGTVVVRVLEEASGKPIEYASAYLTAKNDTLITNFTLTDTSGVARITKVTRGTYVLTVEQLGYKTYNKEHYFNFDWERDSVNLGIVRMAEDVEMLEGARVSAIGNPIEVRQDTVIFNASSFIMGENSMLEDLLKRMPGMEVSSDGTVKYNGETIQKITVGGKTFFFDDPKMALKNLPAKIVDKVKVIDKVSDAEQFTGVATDREKVMDLEFKQEFQHGWFGNATVGAGTTLAGDRKNEMVDDRGFLYSGNAMVSGYNDKDQVVLIGGAYNAPIVSDNAVVVVFRSEEEDNRVIIGAGGNGGIQTYSQAGVNYNTTRLKGLETTAMANYNNSFTDSRSIADRTTLTGGNDIFSHTENKSFTRSDGAKVSFELKNTDRKRFLLSFEPTFRYTGGRDEGYGDDSSRSVEGGLGLNSSSSSRYAESRQFQHNANFSFGVNNLGDKRRNVTLTGYYTLTDYDADSREFSQTSLDASGQTSVKDLFYLTGNRNYTGQARLSYVEPVAKDWNLSFNTGMYASVRNKGKDAFDRTSGEHRFDASVLDKKDYTARNDYYSTSSRNRYVYFDQSVQAQYRKDKTTLQLGAQMVETLNENVSKSLGHETSTGIGEWLYDWNPYMNFRHNDRGKSFTFTYNGRSSRPSVTNQVAEIDISVPTRIRAGNIFLRPGYSHRMNGSIYLNDAQKQTSLNVFISGVIGQRPFVTASWFDNDGIQYSIPVNSGKPSINATIYSGTMFPVTGDKKLSLGISASLSGNRSISYQGKGRLPGLDVEAFDYNKLIAWFWGGENGEAFYSGRSGFSESLTRSLMFTPELSLRYRGESITTYLNGETTMQSAHYSLDSNADTRTWSSSVYGEIEWETPHQWELNTSATYHFYHGFPQGYNEPYLDWYLSITKNIKQFAIGIRFNDILNQTRTTRHVTTQNYVEDAMFNQLGRNIAISFKWNFGKLNASKNGKATNAALKMMY